VSTPAERASQALQHYVEAKGEVFENSSREATDLIANLLHLVARIDEGDEPIDSTLRLPRLHFDAENGNPKQEGVAALAAPSRSELGDSEWELSSLDGNSAAT
jgi:hypothetical protein